MSDPNAVPPRRAADGWLEPGPANMQLIYILYLVGFLIGITPLIGVIIAYVNRGKAEAWVETHYTWAIRTFWIGLLYTAIGVVLMLVLVGFLVFIAVAVWFILRCIIGLQSIGRGEPIRNPQNWII